MYFVFTSFWNYKVKKNIVVIEVLKIQSPAYRMICTTFLVTVAKFLSFSFKEY
jgi:hypothetical protein